MSNPNTEEKSNAVGAGQVNKAAAAAPAELQLLPLTRKKDKLSYQRHSPKRDIFGTPTSTLLPSS
jgi:hypothetical protein